MQFPQLGKDVPGTEGDGHVMILIIDKESLRELGALATYFAILPKKFACQNSQRLQEYTMWYVLSGAFPSFVRSIVLSIPNRAEPN